MKLRCGKLVSAKMAIDEREAVRLLYSLNNGRGTEETRINKNKRQKFR